MRLLRRYDPNTHHHAQPNSRALPSMTSKHPMNSIASPPSLPAAVSVTSSHMALLGSYTPTSGKQIRFTPRSMERGSRGTDNESVHSFRSAHSEQSTGSTDYPHQITARRDRDKQLNLKLKQIREDTAHMPTTLPTTRRKQSTPEHEATDPYAMHLDVDTLEEALRRVDAVKAPNANESEYANDIVRPHAGYSNDGRMQSQGQGQGQGQGPLESTTESVHSAEQMAVDRAAVSDDYDDVESLKSSNFMIGRRSVWRQRSATRAACASRARRAS